MLGHRSDNRTHEVRMAETHAGGDLRAFRCRFCGRFLTAQRFPTPMCDLGHDVHPMVIDDEGRAYSRVDE